MNHSSRVLFTVLTLAPALCAQGAPDTEIPPCPDRQQFTFSWPYTDACALKPRGGTTTGSAVSLDVSVHPGWKALQDPALTDHQRDRLAILAMAGPYRTSFDFLETVGYTPEFKPARPYQSWGTEFVYVVDAKENFISLQHIIVMYFEDADAVVSGPMVMKHWRQDWQYEKRELLTYRGRQTWARKRLAKREARGSWAQTVYQVDDSPRYAAHGHWQHAANVSTWLSDETWRPLPRREYSVRDDYHVLIGTNRHTVTPTGWVQEEQNYKVVLDSEGQPEGDTPYLAKESGVNRYERIIGHDFSAGDEYWQTTGRFWADVRSGWNAVIESTPRLRLASAVNGQPLFVPLFDYAAKIQADGRYDRESALRHIDELLQQYIVTIQ